MLSDVIDEDIPQVVFGADVVMTTSNGEITLHASGPSGRQLIGRYGSTAAAWEALDALDAPDDLDVGSRAA